MIRQDWSTLKKLMFMKTAAGGGAAVEATATGNPLTFQTDLARPLKSLLIPFTPVQSGTGDPSTQNIRSILPWNGLTVWNGGKNLFNGTNVIDGYFATSGGDTIIYSASAGRIVWIPCKPDTAYAISKMVGGKRLSVYASEEEPTINTIVYGVTRISGSGNDVYVFRTPSNAKYICAFVWLSSADTEITAEQMISSVQIEAGQTATAYEPYVPITETDISFPSPVYGGILDVVTGELWATYSFIEKKWNEGIIPTVLGDYTRKQFNMGRETMTAQSSKATERFCNIAPWLVQYSDQSTHYYFYQASEGEQCIAFVFLPTDTDPTTTIQLAVALKNPVLVGTLTPEQITALKGENTIWSDADGSMTAVYLKKG